MHVNVQSLGMVLDWFRKSSFFVERLRFVRSFEDFHSDISFSGSGKDQEERGEGCDFVNCPPKTR